jgi:hypothetical protein
MESNKQEFEKNQNMKDKYHSLNTINTNKQKKLNAIKSACVSLDNVERSLREKIEFKRTELENLQKDYNNVIETYSHIIRTFVKQT